VRNDFLRNKTLSLSKLSVGIDAYVSDLVGDRSFRSRVLGFGLNIGAKLRVEKATSSTNEHLIIVIGNSRLVIAREIAERIIVSVH